MVDLPSLRYGKGIFVSLNDFDVEGIARLRGTTVDDGVRIDAPKEITVCSLRDCDPTVIEKYFAKLVDVDEHKLTALHYALLSDVHVIIVPKNTHVTKPVVVSSLVEWTAAAQHILVIAEPFSTVDIVDVSMSRAENTFRSQGIEVYAQEGATVSLHGVQDLDYFKTHNFVWKRGEAARDACIRWNDIVLGSAFTQLHKQTKLIDEGARCTTNGVFLAAGHQRFDIDDKALHFVGHTESQILSRGIISDNATSVYRGTIRVEKDAAHCVGHQKSHNLLIGDNARCNAVPILEIHNDDVTCSHGASFERINEDQMFYLLSRGLDEANAQRTILLGLAEPLLAALPIEGLRFDIGSRIRNKLGMTLRLNMRNDIRKDFPILQQKINGKRLVYLDSAATSQKPQCVIDAMTRYYEHDNANIHRAVHELGQRATEAYENAHAVVAEFIGAAPEEIIFTRGTTESLNLLAYSLGRTLHKGDEIVLTQMEHHSNIVPWQEIAREKGAIIKYIPVTKEYTLDLKAAKELITKKTKIVSVVHVSNVLGTRNPLEHLCELAHAVGAVFIVDGAQSVGHQLINVKKMDCDFFAFSGHKMYGPTGIGVLYGKKKLLENMHPFQYGGDMISEVTFEKSTWNELPWKFEAGTPNIAGAVGLAAAVRYLQGIGMESLEKHEHEILEYALEALKKIKGLTLIGPRANRGGVLTFTLEGVHPHDVGEILNRYGVAVRGGHHCAMPLHSVLKLDATNRASLGIYNTTEDIDVLVDALKRAQEIFR